MDELAKNHEGDMSEKSTHIREYADKLALQEARANEFKEKMLRFAMNWQSFSQVSAFFSFYAQALPPSRPVSGLTNTGGGAGRLARHGGRRGSGRLGGLKGAA